MSTPAPILPAESKVKLQVLKGLRPGKNYALKEGVTYIGRLGPMGIDIDLSEQESPGVSVAVNRFALVWFDNNGLAIADTGRKVTLINGERIASGKKFFLKSEDTLQFGKTQLQVKVAVKRKTAVQK